MEKVKQADCLCRLVFMFKFGKKSVATVSGTEKASVKTVSNTGKIYTVKSGNGVKPLNKRQQEIFDFFVSLCDKKEIGFSFSQKQCNEEFGKFNEKNMTVSRLPSATELKQVAKYFAYAVKTGTVKADKCVQIHYNKKHGNYSADVVNAKTIGLEFTEKEIALKEKPAKDCMTFLKDYIQKHEQDIDLAMLAEFVNGLIK